MKKIFALILMSLAVCVNANAQNWRNYYNKADELKGTSSHYTNVYINSNGDSFVCWSNTNKSQIVADSGIFDYSTSFFYSQVIKTTTALVGYYKNGYLIERERITFYVHNGDCNIAYPSVQKSHKIIRHLKYVGDVRIIVPKYSGSDFDITIPMNSNISTTLSDYNCGTDTSAYTAKDIEEKYHNIEYIISVNKKEMRNLPRKSAQYNSKKMQNNTLREQLDELDMKYYELTGEYIYNYGGEN